MYQRRNFIIVVLTCTCYATAVVIHRKHTAESQNGIIVEKGERGAFRSSGENFLVGAVGGDKLMKILQKRQTITFHPALDIDVGCTMRQYSYKKKRLHEVRSCPTRHCNQREKILGKNTIADDVRARKFTVINLPDTPIGPGGPSSFAASLRSAKY